MNMQCLGEVAMVCLFAMDLREKSYDEDADKYGGIHASMVGTGGGFARMCNCA